MLGMFERRGFQVVKRDSTTYQVELVISR
jgi:hypothetical protein